MYSVSDASGRIKREEVLVGSIDRSKLNSNDVYLVNTSTQLFIWIGSGNIQLYYPKQVANYISDKN